MSNNYAGDDDLIINPSSRIPVCLVLDVSGSMYDCIERVEEGVERFYESVRNCETAKDSCEIAIVTFGSDVNVLEDFSLVETKKPVHLTATGGTDMTGGVSKALELLEQRKEDYKRNGVDYYQPWIVIMTDGCPNDPESLRKEQQKMLEMESNRKLTTFVLAIGDDTDMEILSGFSKRSPLHLKELKFEQFFEWLGKSVSVVSTSQVGDKVKLDVSTIDEWAEI